MAMTDFDEWLATCDFDNWEEKVCLYRSVAEVDEYGCYKTVEARGGKGWIVHSTCVSEDLLLASKAARKKFLDMMDERFFEGMTCEEYEAYHAAMEHED